MRVSDEFYIQYRLNLLPSATGVCRARKATGMTHSPYGSKFIVMGDFPMTPRLRKLMGSTVWYREKGEWVNSHVNTRLSEFPETRKSMETRIKVEVRPLSNGTVRTAVCTMHNIAGVGEPDRWVYGQCDTDEHARILPWPDPAYRGIKIKATVDRHGVHTICAVGLPYAMVRSKSEQQAVRAWNAMVIQAQEELAHVK